jgi:uncharacterized protein (DUF305 family)
MKANFLLLSVAALLSAPLLAQGTTGDDHTHTSQAQSASGQAAAPQPGAAAQAGQPTMQGCPMAQQMGDGANMMHGQMMQGPMMQGPMMQGQMMGPMQNTASNPYAQTEMQMHQSMMRAGGETADETWVRKMIEHHRGAIAMARIEAAQGKHQDAVRMANKTIASQEKDIAELQAWLRSHNETAQ